MVPVKTNQNWLPSIFNDSFDNEWMARANATAPAINVIENEKDYKVELAAPGMTKNDFKVSVDESNNLVICMEKRTRKRRRRKTENTCAVNSPIPDSSRVSCCRIMWKKIKFRPKWNTGSCLSIFPKS